MATPDPIDWSIATKVARTVAGTGPQTTPEFRAEVKRDFKELTHRSDDLVRGFTHLVPQGDQLEPLVVDRGGWISANIESFRDLVHPLTEKLSTSAPASAVGRRVVNKMWESEGMNMPSLEEMRDPNAWLKRVGA